MADLEERQAILDELAALDTRRKSIRSRIDMANEESDALQREISAFGTDFDRFREELGLPSRHRTDRHLGDKQVDDK